MIGMATRDDEVTGTERRRSRRAAGLSPELIAILAVGVALAGVMLTMMTVMMNSFDKDLSAVREEVQVLREEVHGEVGELRAGQVELRERMVRVESKLDVLAGDWPPEKERGTARQETPSPRG